MKYNVFLINDVDNNTQNIIEKYWKYNMGVFIYNNLELSKQFNLDISLLIQIVKKHSFCELVLNKCNKCNQERKYSVKTRGNFEYIISSFSRICDNCNEYKVLLNEKQKLYNTNQYNTQYAIKNKIWEELLPIELEVLKGIIKFKRKDLIYRYIFNNDTYNTQIWSIINHLEYLGLIFIKRNDKGKILSFDVHKNIEKQFN